MKLPPCSGRFHRRRRGTTIPAPASSNPIEQGSGITICTGHQVRSSAAMTDYPTYRQIGCDCGSGPTESFCGALTRRLKGRGIGMRWDRDNAESIMALGSLYYSNLWANYWAKQRAA